MIIASGVTSQVNTLNWSDLYAAQFTFNQPFALRMQDGQVFFAESVVRMMPKRRMVAFGIWQGKKVVAKLFFDPKHAKRHGEKDVAGVNILQERKVPTPALCYQGVSEDQKIVVLLFEQIQRAKNIAELWKNKQNIDEILPQLRALLVEIATQHVLGVLQHDLHFKNFLLTGKKVYTLDGGQIELFPYLLSKKISMANLALFLSQFGVGFEDCQLRLFRQYAELRGWLLKEDDIKEMFFLIKQCNEKRWHKFSKKIVRESSDFARLENWRMISMYDRSYDSPAFKAFLANPEAIFKHPAATMLKDGRSSTVIKVTMNERTLVIKRYNVKNIFHRLRRCLRRTRAAVSWRLAHKLTLFSVPTAKPIAFIENRYLGFRGASYFVTEYAAGGNVNDYISQHQREDTKLAVLVRRVASLLRNLAKLEITHGDLKATNILLDVNQYPILIDLDGAVEHFSVTSLRKAWRKEIKRFLANFQDDVILKERFRMALNKDGVCYEWINESRTV